MTEKYFDDYTKWLENTLFDVLISGETISSKKLIKKLEAKEIKCHSIFIEYLNKKCDENKLKLKFPLLNTYPIDLSSDIYEDDINKINGWEIETITELYIKLKKQHKDQPITPNIYDNFFNREIEPYKEYFLDETYEKILLKNITKYWSYRIDTSISWDESNRLNKIGIDIISVIESEYLKIEKTMTEYQHLIGDTDC